MRLSQGKSVQVTTYGTKVILCKQAVKNQVISHFQDSDLRLIVMCLDLH